MAASEVEAPECEQVLQVHDRRARATVVLALHDTRLGPAHGGIRRVHYPTLAAAHRDAIDLARAMTFKCALAEVAAGGGKAVLLDHEGLDRVAAYRLVGAAVDQLQGRFFTGPDVGTTDDDLRIVAQVTQHVVAVDGAGPGDLAVATATGVMAALGALALRLDRELRGLHVVVQGLGAVGSQLCAHLHASGARLTVADLVPARAEAAATAFGATIVDPGQVLQVGCDVFAPCGLGGVLTATTAAALPALGVCGAANNIFAEPAAATILQQRGVRVVPDFIANAGALIAGCRWRQTGERVPPERLLRLGITAGEVLDRAAADGVPPSVLALQLARERLSRACPPA